MRKQTLEIRTPLVQQNAIRTIQQRLMRQQSRSTRCQLIAAQQTITITVVKVLSAKSGLPVSRLRGSDD